MFCIPEFTATPVLQLAVFVDLRSCVHSFISGGHASWKLFLPPGLLFVCLFSPWLFKGVLSDGHWWKDKTEQRTAAGIISQKCQEHLFLYFSRLVDV